MAVAVTPTQTALATVEPADRLRAALVLPHAGEPAERRLLRHWLDGRDPSTVAGYRGDLADLCQFLSRMQVAAGGQQLVPNGRLGAKWGARAAELAIKLLFAVGNDHGEANACILAYRAELVTNGLSARTINRRLSAIRSMLKLGRLLGMINWTVEVEGFRVEPIRDTRGPGKGNVGALLGHLGANAQRNKIAARNYAIVRLLYDMGLRRAEVASLDLEHWEPDRRRLHVLGKKRHERLPIDDVAEPTAEALNLWIEKRGPAPGALFIRLERRKKGERMSGQAVWLMVTNLGKKLGIIVRPHGIRHTAITSHLEESGGNVRAAAQFSRHKDLRTVQLYDDNRENLGMKIAAGMAAGMPGLLKEKI